MNGGYTLQIVTVMDNKASEHRGLVNEHGLSFFVESAGCRLLFDFGAGKNTLRNAGKLNIPLRELQYAVCSHGHYDHAGGYPYFVRAGVHCPLVTGEGFFQPKYARENSKLTYLGTGFDRDYLTKQGIERKRCAELLPLSEQCFVMGNFQRKNEFEMIPDRFVIKTASSLRKDMFQDEVCLVVKTKKGLVVIVGCSHPGILNILDSAVARFHEPVHAVIGGTHLMEAGEAQIHETVRRMKELGVGLIGFNHCSGDKVCRILQEDREINAVYLAAGDTLQIPE